MNPKQTILIPVLAAALAVLATALPATADDGGPWSLKVTGVWAHSTAGGGPDGSLGAAVGVEYRPTPRLGVELGALTSEFDQDATIEFFETRIDLESEFRIVPVLARLDLHLTPGRRADLYIGPVAGWVSTSDMDLRLRIHAPPLPDFVQEMEIPIDDELVWGAHAGADVRLGGGRSFLTAGATYLDLPLTLDLGALDPEGDAPRGDLDPVVFHLGYGYSF